MCFYENNKADQKIGNDIMNDKGNIDKMKRMFRFEDKRFEFSNFLLTTALAIKVPIIDL